MVYPDDFDTSAFPAGRLVAASRTLGIWIAVSLFLIAICAIALPWIRMNQKIDPLVIYVDGANGQWELVPNGQIKMNLHQDWTYYYATQRALVGIFTKKWFTISNNSESNDKMWARCARTSECNERVLNAFPNKDGCDIFCMSGEDLYKKFTTNVLPTYETAISFGERWRISPSRLDIKPSGNITANGGTWVVRSRVYSNNGEFDIVAYVVVARNEAYYPQTLGYYVSEFNAYREN